MVAIPREDRKGSLRSLELANVEISATSLQGALPVLLGLASRGDPDASDDPDQSDRSEWRAPRTTPTQPCRSGASGPRTPEGAIRGIRSIRRKGSVPSGGSV